MSKRYPNPMSNRKGNDVRHIATLLCLASAAVPVCVAAQQDDAQTASPPQTIDILVDTAPQDETVENCSPQQEDAAAISGEIVVCRRITGNENRLYSKKEAEERYARETMNQGTIAAPDVAGAGIFRGPATMSGLCFVPPCPKPPAYMVDFSEIPEAPPGSDADRIARGLPPLGSREAMPLDEDKPGELTVPETAAPADSGEVNPRESASPAEPPSD